MASLGEADARPTLGTLRSDLAQLRRDIDYIRSTAKLLRRGTFAPDTIPTSALAQPAAPGLLNSLLTGVAVTAAGGVMLEQTFTVPPRMRNAAVFAIARVYAMNGSGTPGVLLVRAEVEGFQGTAVPVSAAAGAGAANSSPLPVLMNDLTPGALLNARVWAQASNADWPADVASLAELTGIIQWFA